MQALSARSSIISHSTTQTLESSKIAQKARPARFERLKKRVAKFAGQRRTVRYAILVGNFVLLAGIISFVVYGSSNLSHSAQASLAATGSTDTNPLDQLSSADIAANASRIANMPEATAVTNQADTVSAEMAVTANDSLVSKPQIIASDLKTRDDIQDYLVKEGDTVSSIAAKFNVTSDSIKWSNNLSSDTVTPGAHLSIPPLNGIVYTVVAGDTAQSLAAKFSANADQITAFNDAEISGLRPGEKIIVPNGKIQQAAPTSVYARSSSSAGYSFGSSAIYGYNGYDWGFCTWYVANRISVPSNWGNANTWDNLAPLSGWTVSSTPRQGAIAQRNTGTFGHVAYVEAVSPDGTQIKYSDMNGLAGFARVGYSGWVPASSYANYIYR